MVGWLIALGECREFVEVEGGRLGDSNTEGGGLGDLNVKRDRLGASNVEGGRFLDPNVQRAPARAKAPFRECRNGLFVPQRSNAVIS